MASAVLGWSPVIMTTRTPALRSRSTALGGGRAHRVGHAEEARGSTARRCATRRGRCAAGRRALGDREHAVALPGQPVHLLLELAPASLVQRDRRRPSRDHVAQRSSTISGAPLTLSRCPLRPAEHRVVAARRARRAARPPAATSRSPSAGVDAEPLGGRATTARSVGCGMATPAVEPGPGAQRRARRSLRSSGRHSSTRLLDPAVRDLPQADAALGQGPRLVEAEHVDPAQGLDRRRVAYERVARGQPPGRGELGDGGDERQPFRHRGHREAHRRGERRGERRAAEQVRAANSTTPEPDRGRQDPAAQLAQPQLHPARPRRVAGQPGGPARLGRLPGRHDHGRRPCPPRRSCPRRPSTRGPRRRGDAVGAARLGDELRLAGQGWTRRSPARPP